MNFAQVKSITIPEGKVTKITSNGIVLWSGAEPQPTSEIVPVNWNCYRLGKSQSVTVDTSLLQPDTTDPETDVAAGYHNSATFSGTGNPCAYWTMIPEFVTKRQWTNRISHRVDSAQANAGSIWSDGTTEFTMRIQDFSVLDTAGYGVKIYNPIYNKFIGYKEVGYTDKVGIALVDFDDAVVFTIKQGLQGASLLNFQVKNNPRLAGFTLDSYGIQNGYNEWWTAASTSTLSTTQILTWFVGGNAAPTYMWQYSQTPTYHNGSAPFPSSTSTTYITLTTSKLTNISTPFWLSLIETAPGRGKLVLGRVSTSLAIQGLVMGPSGFKKASNIDAVTEVYITDSEQYGKIFTYYPYDRTENYTLYAYTDAATGNVRGGQSRSFGQIPTNLNWVEVKDMP